MMFVCRKKTHTTYSHTQTNYPQKKLLPVLSWWFDTPCVCMRVKTIRPYILLLLFHFFIYPQRKERKKNISSNRRLLYNQCLLLLLLLTNISFFVSLLLFSPIFPPHLIFLYRDFRTFKPLEVDDDNNNDAVISVYTWLPKSTTIIVLVLVLVLVLVAVTGQTISTNYQQHRQHHQQYWPIEVGWNFF